MHQSLHDSFSRLVALIKSVHELWTKLETMYPNKSNTNCTIEIYEYLFASKHGEQTLFDHFVRVKKILEELSVYQPLTIDLQILESHHIELNVDIFLHNLHPHMASRLCTQVLYSDKVSFVICIFSSNLSAIMGAH